MKAAYLNGVEVLVPRLLPDMLHYVFTGQCLKPKFIRKDGHRTRVETNDQGHPVFTLEAMPAELQTTDVGAVRQRSKKKVK